MKEFINKLIGMLEKLKIYYAEDFSQGYSCEVDCVEKYEVKKIVNELAEEYKGNDYWKIIYNKVCELEKKYADCENIESVNDCIKLENLLQYFKEELRGEEEYINTSTDTSTDTSSGWIPCSERLPEANQKVLTCDKDGWISVNVNMPYIGVRNDFECGYYVAWMPLPAPYKEGVTENERNSRV